MAIVVLKANGTPADVVGPWSYTFLDGQAALAVDVDISEIYVESGEETAFAKLDERIPDKQRQIAVAR